MTSPITAYKARIERNLRELDQDIDAARDAGDKARVQHLQNERLQVLLTAQETIREMQALERREVRS